MSEKGAAASRRMIQASWAATQTDEEARSYLQARLARLFGIMFVGFAALVSFVAIQYSVYDAPRFANQVYLLAIVGLGVMVILWRGLLVRRALSVAKLYQIDLSYSFGIGMSFGASALLQYDLRPAAYMSLVYTTFAVFARALIVPSSALRTVGTSIATFIPMTASAAILALTTPEDLPPLSFFFGYLLLGIVPVVLAAFGSHIIYDLQQKVSAAKQLGQYTIERQLGEGGMGAVYRAHHVLLRRPTAIKLLLPDRIGPEDIARFEREVQMTSQLTHPNTVAVFDYGRSNDGTFYYAMEDLGDGIDLEQLVERFGAQSPRRVVHVLAQVCGALQEAHELGIVHRDIKPANIILCERGAMTDVAKVVDYGLVKEIAASGGSSDRIILGTPAFIAPEAVTEPERVGPASDLYALGCVGYYLLTGRRVFVAKTAMDYCMQHVRATPAPLAIGVPALEDVIMRCLAKDPSERPASAAALATELAALGLVRDDAEVEAWWTGWKSRSEEHRRLSEALTITVDVAA